MSAWVSHVCHTGSPPFLTAPVKRVSSALLWKGSPSSKGLGCEGGDPDSVPHTPSLPGAWEGRVL